MDPEIIIATVSFLFTGFLYIGLALPLIKRQIPPNESYGFRAKKAYVSDAVWYEINAYSGRQMRGVGVAILAAVPLLLIAGVGDELYVVTLIGIILLGTTIMIIRSYLYLNKLTKI